MPRISHVGLTLTRGWCKLCLILLTAKGQTVTLRGSSPTAVLGDSFQFTCTVTGGGSLQGPLYLSRGSTPTSVTPCTVNIAGCSQIPNIPGYTCGCVSGQTGVFYTNISSVSRDDDDNWRCQYRVFTSNIVSLDVYYSPIISAVPSNKNVTENTSPNIDCSSNVTHSNSSSTSYRWTGPGGYSKTGAVLDRAVTRNQGGEYTCTATNTAGLSDTAMVIINVQYAPVITSVPRNKDVTENTSPNIDCSSNISPGDPSSTSYRWTGPGGYSKTGAVLDRNVTKYQRGQYTCTATNTAGLSDRAQVNINVQSSLEKLSENNSGIGHGIGIGFGICLPIIIGLSIGVTFLVYKQHATKKKYKETVERDTTQTQVQAKNESTMGERSYSVLHHDSSNIPQYEGIQLEQKGTDGSRQYENLDTEKTKGKSNIYENQEGTKTTDVNLYEDPI